MAIEDMYNVSTTTSRPLKAYMSQQTATSGAVPSASMLEDIISSELNARNNRQYQRKLADYMNRKQELDIINMKNETANRDTRLGIRQQSMQDYRDLISARRRQNAASALSGLGVTALSILGKR
jgi:hypothetical protein